MNLFYAYPARRAFTGVWVLATVSYSQAFFGSLRGRTFSFERQKKLSQAVLGLPLGYAKPGPIYARICDDEFFAACSTQASGRHIWRVALSEQKVLSGKMTRVTS
jgi:hypothetical protein